MSNLEEHIKASPPISSHLMLLAPSFSFSNSIQKLLFLRTQQCTLCIALHCFWVLFQYIIDEVTIEFHYFELFRRIVVFQMENFQRRNLFHTLIYNIQLVNDTLKSSSFFSQLSMVINMYVIIINHKLIYKHFMNLKQTKYSCVRVRI